MDLHSPAQQLVPCTALLVTTQRPPSGPGAPVQALKFDDWALLAVTSRGATERHTAALELLTQGSSDTALPGGHLRPQAVWPQAAALVAPDNGQLPHHQPLPLEGATGSSFGRVMWLLGRLSCPERGGPRDLLVTGQGPHPGVPHGGRAQALGPSSAAVPGAISGSWRGSEAARSGTSAHVWCWQHRHTPNLLGHNASPQVLFSDSALLVRLRTLIGVPCSGALVLFKSL